MTSFGETLVTLHSSSWINFVAFSPSANFVAFGTHDCELNFANVSEAGSGKTKIKQEKLMLRGNPLMSGIFLSEEKFVGTGFDKVPFLYNGAKGANWKQIKSLDAGISQMRSANITGNSFKDKRVYFNNDIKLSSNVEMKETNTMHSNQINCLKVFANDQATPLILSTSDINGYLNWWDVSAV